MAGRYAKLTVVCGRRMTGKTNLTLRQMYKAVAGGRKALIFDATDEFRSYIFRPGDPPHSIKPIFFKDIPRFSAQSVPEIVRVRPFLDNGKVMGTRDLQEHLALVLNTYRNGILLVEDVTTYIAANTPMDIMGKLSTLRQRGVDLVMQYQQIGKAANPQIIGQTNYIRLHKTNDEVSIYKDSFLDKADMMMIAESLVKRRYDWGMKNNIKDNTGEFFSCTIDLEYNKIKSICTQKEVEIAIAEFISDNANRTVKKLQQRRDRQGDLIYKDYQEAYSILEQNMFNNYFEFKK